MGLNSDDKEMKPPSGNVNGGGIISDATGLASKRCAVYTIAVIACQALAVAFFTTDGPCSRALVSSFLHQDSSSVTAFTRPSHRLQSTEEEESSSWLDGCSHLYIDCGTNTGIQIRKLFEPELFPGAQVLPLFNEVFGDDSTRKTRKDLCAIGFEANPIHNETLQALQDAYHAKGWKIKIFTSTAVSNTDGNATFYFDNENKDLQMGASLNVYHHDLDQNTTIKTMDLAAYINEQVAPRKMEGKGTVLMKMDIEGFEHTLMPHLLTTGAICHIDKIFTEYHWNIGRFYEDVAEWDGATLTKAFHYITQASKDCPTQFVVMDDETYWDTHPPLPERRRRLRMA